MQDIILRDMPILDKPTFRYHILPDGAMVDVYAVRYDSKVDIKNHKYLSIADKGYKECTLPTFNQLYANGTLAKEGTCIANKYDYYTDKTRLSSTDIDDIIREFKDNGFTITKEAILHNYDAWLCDEKSGYRDEENNYHLYSPCGCNPLSFRASTLHKECDDWQTTYTC